jgi:hypothetical protein
MPHVSYSDPLCPWPGCGFEFGQIDFHLELVDPALYNQGVSAWHNGLSLVGRCPGCGQDIAFSVKAMALGSTAPAGSVTLPDN